MSVVICQVYLLVDCIHLYLLVDCIHLSRDFPVLPRQNLVNTYIHSNYFTVVYVRFAQDVWFLI